MVARITLGTSGLGGVRQTYGEAAAVAAAILRSPFASIDTSNAYAGGQSELMLGRAIRAQGALPAGVELFSKADADPQTRALDGERVRRSLDESLERLGVDHLPIYHLHDPYSITFAQAMAPTGPVAALLQLRDEGVVGAIGIAAGPLDLMNQYVDTDAFDALLTHNRWTLADRTALPLLQKAKTLGMTVFNAAPFGGGILAATDDRRNTYAYRVASPELLAWIAAARAVSADAGVPLAAVALDFSVSHSLVDSTVVGVSTTQRLAELEALAATAVPDDLRAAIDDLGPPPPSTTST